MEPGQVQLMIDAAIRGAQITNDERRVPKLIAQCRIQAATAARMHALYEEGIIARYAMPCAHLEAGRTEVTVHAYYELVA